MKNAIKQVLKVLAIGVTAAVLGHILSGCDSGGEQDVAGDAGVDSLPSTMVDSLPSTKVDSLPSTKVDSLPVTMVDSQPTTPSNPCAGSPAIVSSSPDEAAKLCVGWSAVKVYKSYDACVTALTPTLTVATAQAECSTTMTGAQCADYDHNFVDSAGVTHGYFFKTSGYYTVLDFFGILDVSTRCDVSTFYGPNPYDYPYCNAKGEYGTCFFKGCVSH